MLASHWKRSKPIYEIAEPAIAGAGVQAMTDGAQSEATRDTLRYRRSVEQQLRSRRVWSASAPIERAIAQQKNLNWNTGAC